MKHLLIILLIAYTKFCYSQPPHIVKRTVGQQAALFIKLFANGQEYGIKPGAFMNEVVALDDSVKIRLLQELKPYLWDTTRVYDRVEKYHYRYLGRDTPHLKIYNIQVNAMVLANYIGFSHFAFYYSPYALLYDRKKKREIGTDKKVLDNIAKIYENWIDSISKNGFVNYTYPLWDKRYQWFGMRAIERVFPKYPEWDTFYDPIKLDEDILRQTKVPDL